MASHLLKIRRFDNKCHPQHPCLRGYLACSTAPINVEDQSEAVITEDPNQVLEEIADYLKEDEGSQAEILILVHGYNTTEEGAAYWYRRTYEYITQHYSQQVCPKFLILGYRWSSERVFEDQPKGFVNQLKYYFKLLNRLRQIFASLPILLALTGAVGFLLGMLGILLIIFQLFGQSTFLLTFVLFIIAALISVPILTIFLLRVSAYFRDAYRASHYGVTDLVELIRQLDDKLLEKTPTENRNENQTYWDNEENRNHRIRLSFIGHSMGAYVVTNAVRTVTDVFDRRSIGKLNLDDREKSPPSDVGNVFRLGRLVLVAPDISAEAIVSGRGNSLRSSLRRFDEAYLFSNEGDMVLKLASTAANSFSFPAKTRDGGHRLGNVIVRNAEIIKIRKNMIHTKDQNKFAVLRGMQFLNCLAIRKGRSLGDRQEEVNQSVSEKASSIAELFTYFDCTDYQENGKGMVSKALGKPFLSWFDSISLLFSNIDGHGGLLKEEAAFSQHLIYGLSCLGFAKFLSTFDPQESDRKEILTAFAKKCQAKGIRILVAAERYEVDVLGQLEKRNQRNY